MSSGVEPKSNLQPVFRLLDRYAQTPLLRAESEIVRVTRAFVEGHPDCLWRTCLAGHLTGSAWVVDRGRSKTLLTHHRKLGKWLQLGGHADGDGDLARVALREAQEESGLTHLQLAASDPFDLDWHVIPSRNDVPEHLHYDFRFLVEADATEPWKASYESLDLAWVRLDDLPSLNPEESMLRMCRKTRLLARGA